MAYFRCQKVILHLHRPHCESIFYHYLQTLFTKIKLSFSSPKVLLGLKYFENLLNIFDWKKEFILLLQYVAFENGHTY